METTPKKKNKQKTKKKPKKQKKNSERFVCEIQFHTKNKRIPLSFHASSGLKPK